MFTVIEGNGWEKFQHGKLQVEDLWEVLGVDGKTKLQNKLVVYYNVRF